MSNIKLDCFFVGHTFVIFFFSLQIAEGLFEMCDSAMGFADTKIKMELYLCKRM